MSISVGSMHDLRNKVAVVIGGARTLGLDMAEVLAEAGCHVAITSRTYAAAGDATQKLHATYGCDVLAAELDIRNHDQVMAFAQQVYTWKGHVDVLINNAGGSLNLTPAHLFERKPEHIQLLIDTNLTGVIYSCKAFGRIMADQGSGSIINIASVAGVVGRDRRMYYQTNHGEQPVDYAAAKAGVIGLTRDLAAVLSPMGVRVNTISPGGFERGQLQAFIEAYGDRTPLGRMGEDGVDLKGAALFLASAASNYVTGHNLVVDGGFVSWR